MNVSTFRMLGLQAYLALNRFGWSIITAGMMCTVGALCWLTVIPYLRDEADSQERALKSMQQSFQTHQSVIPVIQRPLADERAAVFYDALGEKRYAEQQFKMLFAIAKKADLSLNQAEYKSTFDKHGEFHTYQIQLPVKGSYSAIRQFCELVLLAIPYSSLDEMNFKREAVAKGNLEAKLRFTLYLSNRPVLAPENFHTPVVQGAQS